MVELVPHGFDRRHQAVGPDLVEHQANFVGLLPRLFDKSRLAKFNQHSLGPRRDEAHLAAYEQMSSPGCRTRNFRNFGFSGLELLENLFHLAIAITYYFLAVTSMNNPNIRKKVLMIRRGHTARATFKNIPSCL